MHERLAELVFDVRHLDLAGFGRWLEMHLARWANDPLFVQRTRIRDLRRAHPELQALEAARRQAQAADAASEHGPRLNGLGRQIFDVDRAIAGLSEALLESAPEKRSPLEAKLAAFTERRQQFATEHDDLAARSLERLQLIQANAALDKLRKAIGLEVEEAHLDQLQTTRGRDAGHAGAAFEEEALTLTRTQIEPCFAGANHHILQTVRLGAVGVELDIVIVRRDGGPESPVEVLAIVEAKRNINDLGHGFRRRQIDLGWLTGDRSAYDPVEHRTGVFTTGHFDRPVAHWQDGNAFVFGPDSFRRFRRGHTGHFIEGLFLVTRAGPIWGLSVAALSRVAASIATDKRWDPYDKPYLQRLFDWTYSLANRIETSEVVNLYAAYVNQLRIVKP